MGQKNIFELLQTTVYNANEWRCRLKNKQCIFFFNLDPFLQIWNPCCDDWRVCNYCWHSIGCLHQLWYVCRINVAVRLPFLKKIPPTFIFQIINLDIIPPTSIFQLLKWKIFLTSMLIPTNTFIPTKTFIPTNTFIWHTRYRRCKIDCR